VGRGAELAAGATGAADVTGFNGAAAGASGFLNRENISLAP
jgi:hypothetical protein